MIELTNESCVSRYVECMTSALAEHQSGGEFHPTYLNTNDLQAIEYVLKDISKRPISANLNQKKCAEIFAKRVKNLTQGTGVIKTEEWEHLISFIVSNSKLLSEDAIKTLTLIDRCQKHFNPKKIIEKKVTKTRIE